MPVFSRRKVAALLGAWFDTTGGTKLQSSLLVLGQFHGNNRAALVGGTTTATARNAARW